ncbi:hypothetical protein BOW53_07835 [Solemya pervernicosa gill symbiont]|uniref:Uncharacterized protein n=2 Tax=Solemya pervernicosa gill symbiont TaxID=642797 RepID=A0A1T2L612_9GAMM|nr:hypothetical protein BOW53_07835 [Solemya pervernicosa gill symbiont]
MLNHKLIKQTANDYLHSKIYRNLDSYYDKNAKNSDYIPEVDDSIDHMPLEDKRDHYIKVYEEYNREVIEYFKKYAPEKLFITSLSDNNKWLDIGGFLGIKVNVDYECHANKTIGGPNS